MIDKIFERNTSIEGDKDIELSEYKRQNKVYEDKWKNDNLDEYVCLDIKKDYKKNIFDAIKRSTKLETSKVCIICKCYSDLNNEELDHIIAKNGTGVFNDYIYMLTNNLMYICRKCNSKKSKGMGDYNIEYLQYNKNIEMNVEEKYDLTIRRIEYKNFKFSIDENATIREKNIIKQFKLLETVEVRMKEEAAHFINFYSRQTSGNVIDINNLSIRLNEYLNSLNNPFFIEQKFHAINAIQELLRIIKENEFSSIDQLKNFINIK